MLTQPPAPLGQKQQLVKTQSLKITVTGNNDIDGRQLGERIGNTVE